MNFYNVTDQYKSLVHELWSLCDADITSYPLAEAARRVNASLEELVGVIINNDGTWEWDDTNHTDLPRGTGTLVEGQQSYSFASEYLQITMIEIKDVNGNWVKLKPLDKDELGMLSSDEYFGLTSGNPKTGFTEFYDQLGDSLLLYPAPTSTYITLASGLRIWFKRTIDLFTAADTTQEPGLPSTHHVMLAFMAAIPYCMKYHKDRVPLYEKKVDEMKVTLLKHFAHREKSKRKIMTPKRIDFGVGGGGPNIRFI